MLNIKNFEAEEGDTVFDLGPSTEILFDLLWTEIQNPVVPLTL